MLTAGTNLGSHGFRLNQNPKHPFCSKQKCGKKNNCWSLWQQLKNKRINNQRKNLWNENKDHFSKNMTFLGFFVFFVIWVLLHTGSLRLRIIGFRSILRKSFVPNWGSISSESLWNVPQFSIVTNYAFTERAQMSSVKLNLSRSITAKWLVTLFEFM